MSKPTPTIKDVARAAGVSIATVSYVLNNSGRFSDVAAKKVNEAVKKLGYKPNRQAAALKTKRTHLIGFLVRTIETEGIASTWSNISSEVLYLVASESARHGYSIVVIPNTDFSSINSLGIDALVVSDSLAQEPAFNIAKKLNIPIGTNERPDDPRISLNLDNGYWDMTIAALDLLKSKGAKKIGLLSEPGELYSDQRVERAYSGWCASNQKFKKIARGNYSKSNTIEIVNKLIDAGVDAIYSFYEEGPEILSAINARGLKVPQDIMLVAASAFDDRLNKSLGISTVVYQPTEKIREFMVEFIKIIKGDESIAKNLSTDFALNKYSSTND